MTTRRAVVIGAAGEMAAVAIERWAAHDPATSFDLYDLDGSRLAALAGQLPSDRARTGELDLFDREALGRAVEGADLVVLGAGPYVRTAAPVMRACVEAGVDYLDFDDDIESTQDALGLDGEARAAGIALLIGCGASPGMTNVMAVDAASQLDELQELDVCFVTGDEGPRPYGPAVIEHILHIIAGESVGWRDGRQTTVEIGKESEVFALGGTIGEHRLYEVAHPEVVTLPRRYPAARSVRVMGGIHPQPVNGVAQGIARAVERERLTVPEAVEWFQAVMQDETGSLRGWRYGFSGMLGQVRRRESSIGELARFLWASARKRHPDYRGCLLVRATGIRRGEATTVTVKTATGGPGTYFGSSLAAITGTCVAAFGVLAQERATTRPGTLAPEDWVEPRDFYAALERVGVPRHEILDPPREP